MLIRSLLDSDPRHQTKQEISRPQKRSSFRWTIERGKSVLMDVWSENSGVIGIIFILESIASCLDRHNTNTLGLGQPFVTSHVILWSRAPSKASPRVGNKRKRREVITKFYSKNSRAFLVTHPPPLNWQQQLETFLSLSTDWLTVGVLVEINWLLHQPSVNILTAKSWS